MPDTWDFTKPRNQNAQRLHRPLLTWALCGLSILFTLANQTADQAAPGTLWYQIGHLGYLPATDIWAGHYAALLTSVFVHGSPSSLTGTIMHIGFNMVWLLQLGAILEESLNPFLYALFIMIAAIVSSGAEVALSSANGVWMSGVVYAMFGLMWAGRAQFPSWRAVATRQNLNTFIIWGLFCVFATWMGALRIANAAHGGGFLFGLAVGWLFVDKRRHRLASIASLIALVALTVLSVTWMPWSARWNVWKGDQEAKRGHYPAALALFNRSLSLGEDRSTIYAHIYYNIYQKARSSEETQMAQDALERLLPTTDPEASNTKAPPELAGDSAKRRDGSGGAASPDGRQTPGH